MYGTVLRALPYILVAFLLSLVLTPIVKRIGVVTGSYASENKRTVHHGKVVRIGGLAIFTAFCITMAIFVKADRTIDGILMGALIVFLAGLIDDIINLRPLYKFLLQIIGAVVAVWMGKISLTLFSDVPMSNGISFVISVFWIVGVTNAINLIDGLDGLSSGISIIVLAVIGFIGYFMSRMDVVIIALILVGAIGGFLPYNFHPASIFVGDSGALFMGYMIACLSLLGFKSSTFITLGFPIIILFVPLADTSLAIIRRKVKGQKISEADRSHLHHVLMYKIGFGHKNTVLLLYGVTAAFGLCAIITYFNQPLGILILIILSALAWIFIELTGMINYKFHPIISLCRLITGHPKKDDDSIFEANKIHHK